MEYEYTGLACSVSAKSTRRQAGIFNKPSSIRTHGDITISTTGETWVDTCAECGLALLAVTASTVCNVERHHNSVTLLEKCAPCSNLLNDSLWMLVQSSD